MSFLFHAKINNKPKFSRLFLFNLASITKTFKNDGCCAVCSQYLHFVTLVFRKNTGYLV